MTKEYDPSIEGRRELNNKPEVLDWEMFLVDNHSKLAEENRAIWKKNQREGNMHGVAGCSDARPTITEPEKSYSILSITAGLTKVFPEIISSPGIKDFIVTTHFDGATAKPGTAISGCGGLQEKEALMARGVNEPPQGVIDYVHNQIDHPDAIVQSVSQAKKISSMMEKPVLAATQDHRTGRVYPIAAFWRRHGTLLSAINEDIDYTIITPSYYNPEEIYKNGLPSIDYENLADGEFKMFYEYIKSNREMVAQLALKYPDIEEKQRVQNPSTIVLTTDQQPARLRYPSLLEEPGSYFRISIPRRKDSIRKTAFIATHDLDQIMNQTEYPVSHAVLHHGDHSKPFSKVGTVFIETSNMELSEGIADEALKKSWMREWASIEGHKIIAASATGGVIKEIKEII